MFVLAATLKWVGHITVGSLTVTGYVKSAEKKRALAKS